LRQRPVGPRRPRALLRPRVNRARLRRIWIPSRCAGDSRQDSYGIVWHRFLSRQLCKLWLQCGGRAP